MKPLLTIIIPTYRNTQTCMQCLVSLIKYTEYPFKVVVVNNDPSEDSREHWDAVERTTDFKDLSIIHLGSNKGWMGAINAGMEYVDTPLVCMMNDDLIFPPNSREFWRCLARHLGGEVAAVGPSSNFVMGRQSIFELMAPPVLEVKYLIGFCLVLRTDVFREVGLLDEGLPGGDDLDLSIRLRKAGYTLVAEKEAYVHHIGSLTGQQVFGSYWNSAEQTDLTNNCLIRKHGLKAWFECANLEPWKREEVSPQLDKALTEEDRWWKESFKTLGEGAKGLDLGSGDRTTEGVWSLDVSRPGGRSAGGRKFTDATPDVTADATDLPVQAQSLDFVAARHLFEHLLDPVEALVEWKRVLKPSGTLLVACPDQNRSPTMLMDYTHVHAYTPESLERLLVTTGWSVEEKQLFAVGSFGLRARMNGVSK